MDENTEKETPRKLFWLMLKNTYFNQLEQKKMKRQPNGKDMQVIYLRMMLLSIDKAGYIYYQGVCESLEEELALEFDEDIDLIKETIKFLSENDMITIGDDMECYIPEAAHLIKSECNSAERVRRHREKKKTLQCNTDVTKSNGNIKLNINKKKDKDINTISSEPETAPSNQSGILILLNDKSSYDVPLDKIALWKETYPAVDVEQELRKMVAWSHSNPTRRKTRRGVNRFINSWMAREQDRGGSRTTKQQEPTQTDEEFYAPYREMYKNLKPSPDDPFQ